MDIKKEKKEKKEKITSVIERQVLENKAKLKEVIEVAIAKEESRLAQSMNPLTVSEIVQSAALNVQGTRKDGILSFFSFTTSQLSLAAIKPQKFTQTEINFIKAYEQSESQVTYDAFMKVIYNHKSLLGDDFIAMMLQTIKAQTGKEEKHRSHQLESIKELKERFSKIDTQVEEVVCDFIKAAVIPVIEKDKKLITKIIRHKKVSSSALEKANEAYFDITKNLKVANKNLENFQSYLREKKIRGEQFSDDDRFTEEELIALRREFNDDYWRLSQKVSDASETLFNVTERYDRDRLKIETYLAFKRIKTYADIINFLNTYTSKPNLTLIEESFAKTNYIFEQAIRKLMDISSLKNLNLGAMLLPDKLVTLPPAPPPTSRKNSLTFNLNIPTHPINKPVTPGNEPVEEDLLFLP